jgi:hypothetical protein
VIYQLVKVGEGVALAHEGVVLPGQTSLRLEYPAGSCPEVMVGIQPYGARDGDAYGLEHDIRTASVTWQGKVLPWQRLLVLSSAWDRPLTMTVSVILPPGKLEYGPGVDPVPEGGYLESFVGMPVERGMLT